MGTDKRTYDAEFREGAVRIVIETGKPIPQVAEELGVHPGGMAAGARDPAPGSRLFRSGGEVSPRRWDFISDNRADFGVKRICQVLGVSRSGYYRQLATEETRAERQAEEKRTVTEIRAIHTEHRGAYGAPRVHAEMRARGRNISTASASRG